MGRGMLKTTKVRKVIKKLKICKVCKCGFAPHLSTQTVCDAICTMSLAVSIRGKLEKTKAVKERKADKIQRDKLKSRAQWASEAQSAVNLFIRLRDADLPCISCGRHHQGQYHAGHYLSRGARPELRYVESNIHKQCQPCNVHLSGNAVLFRQALLQKIGLDAVEWLEGPHECRKHSIDDLKDIKQKYAAKAKELKAQA